MKYILNEPFLSDLEKEYVIDVLASKWLSCNGKHTRIFEEKFGVYVGVKHCMAVQSGTAALHLALKAVGVSKDDYVIIPNYSCGATISTVLQCGATPVVMDVETDTFGLDASRLESALKKYWPKAVQLVHVYGFPARDTMVIKELCNKYDVCLVEDASEALGARLDNKMIGQFGDVATFSIRSEKMIGIGEGGVVVTNNSGLYEKALLFASRSAPFRGQDSPYWAKYYYDGEGYNYLLPHLLGAVARAQIERFDSEILPEKRKVGALYRDLFSEVNGVRMQKIDNNIEPVYWLNSLIFENMSKTEVRSLANFLMLEGVEVRPGFWPLSDMSAFRPEAHGLQEVGFYLYDKLLVLPSAYWLKREDIIHIKEMILGFSKNKQNKID